MIHDRHGDVVETNVQLGRGRLVYLVLTSPEAIAQIEAVFDTRATLEPMPPELWIEGVPTYFLSPREELMRRA